MIKIVEVKTKKEQKRFLNFPLKLYKKCPYFVPPLYSDEKKIFSKDYMYYDQSVAVYYNAYLDNKMVGRISGIIQKAANEKWNQKRLRFTRFDCIDNQEVAFALFKAIEDYAIANEMDTIVGPLGFSDLEREGLLIEGFDQLSTYEEQYNYEYYPKLLENYGFVKEVDWLERKLTPKEVCDPRVVKLANSIMKKNNLHFPNCKNAKEFLNKYGDAFFEILDVTYKDLYQTVPITDKVKKDLIKNFKLIIDVKRTAVILDENEKVVAFGLAFPSMAKAVNKCKGHLTPFGAIRLLWSIKHPKVIDLGLIGVLPEYQMKGIGTILLIEIDKMLRDKNVEYAETNLNLEDNHSINNQWKLFDSTLHKRRRSYVKNLKG